MYNVPLGRAYHLLTGSTPSLYWKLTLRSIEMNTKGPIPLTETSPTDSRWELVLRVADSVYFCKGPKLRAFLLYVCENSILGRLENVREQLIGAKVFGRAVDYDLSDDNIVRVEARELRKRLEAYFANEGQSESLVIEIPKGAYVPIFRPREHTTSPPQGPEFEGQAKAPVGPAPGPARVKSWRIWVVATGLIVWAGITGWSLMENQRLREVSNVSSAGEGAIIKQYSFYHDLLGSMGTTPNHKLQLVLCSPKVVSLYGSPSAIPSGEQEDTPIPVPKGLERALSPAFNGRDREMPYHFLRVTRTDYTGAGEACALFSGTSWICCSALFISLNPGS